MFCIVCPKEFEEWCAFHYCILLFYTEWRTKSERCYTEIVSIVNAYTIFYCSSRYIGLSARFEDTASKGSILNLDHQPIIIAVRHVSAGSRFYWNQQLNAKIFMMMQFIFPSVLITKSLIVFLPFATFQIKPNEDERFIDGRIVDDILKIVQNRPSNLPLVSK